MSFDADEELQRYAKGVKPEDEGRVRAEFSPKMDQAQAAGAPRGLLDDARYLYRKMKEGRLSGWTWAALVGALIYFISPIDAVPDFIPILGWLDDAAVLSMVVAQLRKELGE